MTIADQIWNRACDGKFAHQRAGDEALAALLLFHGAAMNGGIDHAVDCLSAEEVERASCGYCYFGFVRVAQLVSEAPDRFRGLDEDAHEAYLTSAQDRRDDD